MKYLRYNVCLDISLNLSEGTEKKLKKIFDRYPEKEQFAQSIIEYEISEIKKGIVNIQIDLKKIENKYNLSTENLYKEFEFGEIEKDIAEALAKIRQTEKLELLNDIQTATSQINRGEGIDHQEAKQKVLK